MEYERKVGPSRGFAPWSVGLAMVVVALVPTQATAQTPVVRAMAGNGFSDAYGMGVGASAGVDVPFIRDRQFFLGLRTMYHFGSDGSLTGLASEGQPDPTGTISQFQTGLEIGATWMTAPVFIRMVGGVGASRVNLDVESGESDLEGVNYKVQYGPGILLALPLDSGAFAGVEIRYLKVSGLESALAIYGTFGKKFF